MKVRVKFLEPVNTGHRTYSPGEVAFLSEDEAQSLMAVHACESVGFQRNAPIRVSIVLPDERESA